MKAKSIKGKSAEELQIALEQSLADGFRPALAIVFISVKQDYNTICSLLNRKGIYIFGCTTCGEFISGIISEGGIAVMLLDINPAFFKIELLEAGDRSFYEVSKQLGARGRQAFANASFIIAGGWLYVNGEQVLKGIEDGFKGSPCVFGGMAGDDLLMKETFVFTNGRSSNAGIIALIIDESKIHITGLATCGWKPVGTPKTVTKSNFNTIYALDDQPALDIIMKYLGLNIDPDPKQLTRTNIGSYYPLQLEREGAPPVMRTAMWGNFEDRSILCAGNVPQGSRVRFSLPPDFDVIDTVAKECSCLKSGKQKQTDAVIMFSCVTRHLALGAMVCEEIESVMKVWDAPFIGFFTYGEFGKSPGGQNEFHNNTCCVVILKEK